MEQMMVQAAAPVQGVQGVSFRALQGALAGQQPVGDGFAMLFQQLMGALNGEGDPMGAARPDGADAGRRGGRGR